MKRVRMREPLFLCEQVTVLTLGRREPFDLTKTEPERVGLHRPFHGLCGDLVKLTAHVAVAVIGTLILAERHREFRAGVAVERFPLTARFEQLLLVGLAMHGYQVIGEVGEQAHGNRPAAGECTRAALG